MSLDPTSGCCNENTPLELGLKPIEESNSSSSTPGNGVNGKSAYEIAVANGYIGTESQWLDSLQGEDAEPAEDGEDGESAYQIWLSLGNTGTEADFIASLSANARITEEWTANTTVGNVVPGTTGFNNLTLTQFAKKLTVSTFYPTFVAPSFAMSNNAGALRKIGEVIPLLGLTLTLNRGSILGVMSGSTWQPNTQQNPRSGIATNYRFNNLGEAGAHLDQAGPTFSKVNHVVTQGLNSFVGSITYAAGPQPKNSDNTNTDANGNVMAPLAGGTSANQTTQFEGVYPWFGTTQSITTATEQSTLYSMLTGNNIQLTLVAETGGSKQFVDIPKAWLDARPIVDVQYFNVVSGQFDITGKAGDLTQTAIVKSINSVNVNYVRLTHNKSDRGSQLLRFVF